MKPRLLTILLLLLAGAVVNVGVAWWCAAWSPVRLRTETVDPKYKDWVQVLRNSLMPIWRGSLVDGAWSYAGIGVSIDFTRRTDPTERRSPTEGLALARDTTRSAHRIEYRAGWPMHSLQGVVTWDERQTTTATIGYDILTTDVQTVVDPMVRGWVLATSLTPTRPDLPFGPQLTAGHLPYAVAGLGFGFNTLFYAALLWLLFLGPFTLRRHLRARRGLCPACAYPVGEASVCSECGKAVNARSTSPIAE